MYRGKPLLQSVAFSKLQTVKLRNDELNVRERSQINKQLFYVVTTCNKLTLRISEGRHSVTFPVIIRNPQSKIVNHLSFLVIFTNDKKIF